jgi:hypothetical protein
MVERGRFYQQFGERSGNGETGRREVQTSRGVPQEQSWYEQDIPYEQLVSTLRYFMEKESVRSETPIHQFPTAEWLGYELMTQAAHAVNRDAPIEEQSFFNGLSIGWHAFAYGQFGESARGMARKEIEEYIQMTGSKSVTLRPKAVKLFDVMAEVAGIPHMRGEATVDLTLFAKRENTRIVPYRK